VVGRDVLLAAGSVFLVAHHARCPSGPPASGKYATALVFFIVVVVLVVDYTTSGGAQHPLGRRAGDPGRGAGDRERGAVRLVVLASVRLGRRTQDAPGR